MDNGIYSLKNFYIKYDSTSPFINKLALESYMYIFMPNPKSRFIIPITDDLKELITINIKLSMSKYESIREYSDLNLFIIAKCYRPLLNSIIKNMTNEITENQFEQSVDFLIMPEISNIIEQDCALFSKILLLILKNFDLKDKEKLMNLKLFLNYSCLISLSFNVPKSNKQEFVDLLNEIEKNYLTKNTNNRTYNYILTVIIFICMKRVKNVSGKIFDFLMKNVTHFDVNITVFAEICVTNSLKRKLKCTKEKIEVKKISNNSYVF